MAREQLFGGIVAVIGVAVIAVGGYTLLHPPVADSQSAQIGQSSPAQPSAAARTAGSAPSSRAASTTGTTPTPSTSSVNLAARAPLIVLNNTTVAGVASRAATQFRHGGWTVSWVGDLRDDILSSCAYYDPEIPGAQQAAAALKAQFPRLKRVATKFAGLPAGPVVVALAPDWS